MMRFIYTEPNGGVCVATAAPKANIERILGPLTDEQYRAHIMERLIPSDALMVQEAPDDWTATDEDFSEAWRQDPERPSALLVDMARARDVWRDKMRAARRPLLQALDVEYQRADEVANTAHKAQVAGRKQALRDVTEHPAIEAAKTTAELRAVWPDCLKP